jgi:prepilin-type N-terminal cleavage/methylation domain-containing protein
MRKTRYHRHGLRGFSLIEIMVAVVIGTMLTAIAIPSLTSTLRSYRSAGDARDLSGEVSLAKMRAAATYTRARVYADLSANQFRVETWTLPSGGASNCWIAEGVSSCSQSYSGSSKPPQAALSKGVSFGFGSLTTSPSGGAIAQAPACLMDDGTSAISNTACVLFNSRGIPVDSGGTQTSLGNVDITDGGSVYGVTVFVTGLIQTWRADVTSATWKIR